MQRTSAGRAHGVRWSIGRKITLLALTAAGTAVMVGAWINSALHSIFLAWDFPVFYIAARMPLSHLYDPAAFSTFWQQHLQPLGVVTWSPYNRPAVFAVLTRPLGLLPYQAAFLLWVIAGACAYAASLALLVRRFHLPVFVVPAYVGFFPAAVGIASGQDNCLFLLAVIAGWLLLEAEHDSLAGLVFGCCLYKYNLILLIPVLLFLRGRSRALTSFAISGGLLAAASLALASPDQYFDLLLHIREISPFTPAGLRGAAMVLGLHWSYPPAAIAVFLISAWLMRRLALTQAFCIAIIGTLLISPYVTWYDSTLLCLPIAVVIASANTALSAVSILLLVLQPLWRSEQGPMYVTPAIVGLLLLTYFIVVALRYSDVEGSIATEPRSVSLPGSAFRLHPSSTDSEQML